jgi:hypothetical protein
MKQLITILMFAFAVISSNAQNVGIGTTNPNQLLTVTGIGNTSMAGQFTNNGANASWGVLGSCNSGAGIYGIGAEGDGGTIGVRGQGPTGVIGDGTNTGSGSSFGVYGDASGGTTAYGIYGTAANATSYNWAGYFASGNVYIQNNLGIGTANPAATIDVTGNGYGSYVGRFTYTGTSSSWGLLGSCNAGGGNYGIGVEGDGGTMGIRGQGPTGVVGDGSTGVDGEGTNTGTGSSYGVYADASGSGITNYGIFARADQATTNWAGYFVGNTFCTNGMWQSSDRKLKNNIQPLSGAIAIINRLNPSVYTFKTTEYKQMNLPEGLQYGLIADEVQEVIPGAVKKAIQPAEYENNDMKKGKKLGDDVEFNAVNYTEMIPILIAGMKEQQKMIEQLQMQLADQQKQIEEIKKLLK